MLYKVQMLIGTFGRIWAHCGKIISFLTKNFLARKRKSCESGFIRAFQVPKKRPLSLTAKRPKVLYIFSSIVPMKHKRHVCPGVNLNFAASLTAVLNFLNSDRLYIFCQAAKPGLNLFNLLLAGNRHPACIVGELLLVDACNHLQSCK